MHGKTSKVFHHGTGIFSGLSDPLVATRYHSLIADRASLPKSLEVTAWLKDGTIMGLRHKAFQNLYGVQFHPEFSANVIKEYINIWADHKRNDLKKIEFFIEDDLLPYEILIHFKERVFRLEKI